MSLSSWKRPPKRGLFHDDKIPEVQEAFASWQGELEGDSVP